MDIFGSGDYSNPSGTWSICLTSNVVQGEIILVLATVYVRLSLGTLGNVLSVWALSIPSLLTGLLHYWARE